MRCGSLLLASLLGAMLLVACPEPEPEPVDDDDTIDDDDTGDDLPLEGDWAGPATGVVIFPGGGTQPCEGTGDATVDADDRAAGHADCLFQATGELCAIEFTDFEVGGGNRPADFECWAAGEATLSNWFDGVQLHGRVQLFSDGYQVEVRWDLDPVP